jgi:2-amino-4-hydroxy-6-hydroxymethyldihydropteridine diphosphokinase
LVVPERPSRVAVALGTNLGNREQTLRDASAALRAHIDDLRVSAFHDTAPVGLIDQPRFLNAAATGVTALAPRDLLDALLEIERRFGRVRSIPNAPRTLDLDLILYADLILEEAGLVVPHPRFRERRFVLRPLAEIAAEWIDPVTGMTIAELLGNAGPSA